MSFPPEAFGFNISFCIPCLVSHLLWSVTFIIFALTLVSVIPSTLHGLSSALCRTWAGP
ncbi:hypothetical protein CPC08DRAFT_701928 [Agrocybe pediades]|nr:hypothetical protein CPC08DRAFT_701928 [Agrocybe pediades]